MGRNNPMYGRKVTDEHREKNRIGNLGKKRTEKTKQLHRDIQNRPWKRKKKITYPYNDLCNIYNIWVNNNKPKRWKLQKLCNTDIDLRSVIKYFINYGDPKLDIEYMNLNIH